MPSSSPTPEQWLFAEDESCRAGRIERLSWLATEAPTQSYWQFPGGWLAKHTFEEARYCFVYGQFIAAAVLGFSFVDRTLAAMFYAAGRNDLERASSERLLIEARNLHWLSEEEVEAFDRARRLRNPLVHFRRPLHHDLPERRSLEEEKDPYDIIEGDARHVIHVMFRLLERNAG